MNSRNRRNGECRPAHVEPGGECTPPEDASPAECREVREYLHFHVEGELDPIRSNLVEAHLRKCGSCRKIREEMEQERLWVLEVALDSPDLSERFRERVIARIEEEQHRTRVEKYRGFFFRASGVAVALLVFALASWRSADTPSPAARLAARATGPQPEVGSIDPTSVTDTHGGERYGPDEPEGSLALETPRLDGKWQLPQLPPDTNASQESVRLAAHLDEVISVTTGFGSHMHELRSTSREDPCKPDPNKDGKVDLNDIAYSCQVLLGGSLPQTMATSEGTATDPDCEDICLKA